MKHYKLLVIFLNLLLIAGSFTSCKKSSFEDTPSRVSLYQIIKDDTQFSMFRFAVDRAGLQDLLKESNGITLIAPTNAAFAEAGYGNVPGTFLEKFTINEITLLVKNHMIEGKPDLTTLTGTTEIKTMNKTITFTKKGNDFYVDGGDITHLTVIATNGLMYVSNRLLIPAKNNILETLQADPGLRFTSLIAAINRASQGSTNFTQLLSGTTPYTLFAPTNVAFIAAGYANAAAVTTATPATLETLLKRHIIAGRKLTSDLDSVPVNTLAGIPAYFDREKISVAQTITTRGFVNGVFFNYTGSGGGSNIIHQNGLVYHTVAQVLPLPVAKTTLEQIKSDPTLTFFDAAIDQASQGTGVTVNFANLLSDPLMSYTVFAPTNDAFQAAGYQTIASVRAAPIGALTNLLKYHMVKRRWASGSIGENSALPTLLILPNTSGVSANTFLTFTVTGAYKVKGATSTTTTTISPADIVTKNGLLNVIGMVLTP